MKIEIQTGEDLSRLLKALLTEIVNANSYYRLVSGLASSRPTHERAFQQSEVFWYLTENALKDACLMNLCRIYDQNSKGLNLVNLLHTIKANLHLFSEAHFRKILLGNAFVDALALEERIPKIEELERDIETVTASEENKLVKKLMIWRNNIVAHHNAQLSLGKNQILEDNPLIETEIQLLLKHSLNIFNKYSSLYGNYTQLPDLFILGQDDYKSLLKFISLGLKKRDEDTSKPFNIAELI